MKLVLYVDMYGGRQMVRPDWQSMVFFSGKPPAETTFIVLESKRLHGTSADAVKRFIEEETGRKLEVRDVVELPEALWRPATLDDFIDAHNAAMVTWYVQEAFPVESFAGFAERWVPSVVEATRRVLAEAEPKLRLRAYRKLEERAERVYATLARTSARATKERERLAERLELEAVDELGKRPPELERWAELFAELGSWPAIYRLGDMLATELCRAERTDEELNEWMERFWGDVRMRDQLRKAPGFWRTFERRSPYRANVRGETIDITNAVEQKAASGWELWRGRRVGRIVPGRNALVIASSDPRKTTFVRGERRLKHAAGRGGGEVRRFGCTLTVPGSSEGSLSRALLEVERIETLANVAPASLSSELAKLPSSHLAHRALELAPNDPRQARILADLVIEYSVGIDADVARALARAQSVGNKRRR